MKKNKSLLGLIVICLFFIASIVILAPESLNIEVFAAYYCPAGQTCYPGVSVDVFSCNYNPGPPRSCYITLQFPPPGSASFGCDPPPGDPKDCSTTYPDLCSWDDRCLFTDPYETACGWWRTSCTGPYCAACSGSNCCAAAACTCGGWVSQDCGGGSCPPNQRLETQDCNPDGCLPESQCVDDPACAAPPTCSVDGPDSVILGESPYYSVTPSDPDGDLTGAEIWVSPTSGQSWTNVYSGAGAGGGSYPFPSEGTYYIVCNAFDASGNRCSGNPWCSAWPPTATPEVDCTGWVDCTASDVLTVTVIAPSCTIDVPDLGISVAAGETVTVMPNLPPPTNGSIDQVEFVISDPSVATVCEFGIEPCVGASYTDDVPGFRADLAGQSVSPPKATLTVTATMVEGPTCTDDTTVTVTSPGAWWQVHEGDAICGGNISSIIPASAIDPYFITYNESPGIPMFSGTIDTGSGGVSSPIPPFGWQAEGALYSSTETHDYSYFFERIPDAVVPADPGSSIGVNSLATTGFSGPSGYYWFSHSGDLTITNPGGETLGNNRVVLFVDGSLTIEGNIPLDDGLGFFAAIVSGNIIVDPGVGGVIGSGPHLEGLYIANSQFRTGTTGSDNDSQLHIRGSVVGLAGVVLERSMADNSKYPAEIFEYGVDQAFFFPSDLGTRRILWHEVAP